MKKPLYKSLTVIGLVIFAGASAYELYPSYPEMIKAFGAALAGIGARRAYNAKS